MKARSHSMSTACPETRPSVPSVQVEVSLTHPLLLLKQALPWAAINEVMTHHWRHHGKLKRGDWVLVSALPPGQGEQW